MEDYQPQSRAVIWWVVFLIVLIIVIAVGVVFSNKSSESVDNLGAAGQVGLSSDNFDPVLSLADQVSGTVVSLTEVKVNQGAWVAIHADLAGAPGPVLGAGYFDAQVTSGAVDLSESTKPVLTYYAVLYHDINDDQYFDPLVEVPWLNQAGQAIITPFQVISSLEEDKG